MAIDYFSVAGTDDFSGGYFRDPYGGNGVTLAEQADVANGSYDYGGTAGGIIYANDAAEAARLGGAYPSNGQSLDWNMATLGITRMIDSAARAVAISKGSTAATYAGQNGLTYTNGRTVASVGGGLLPLLLIGAALFVLAK